MSEVDHKRGTTDRDLELDCGFGAEDTPDSLAVLEKRGARCSISLAELGRNATSTSVDKSPINNYHVRDWMENAKCRGGEPNTFFPSEGVGVAEAKMFCLDCVVRAACLEYAIENGQVHGVWGGASERERKEIARNHRNASK